MFGYPVPKDVLEAKGKPAYYWGARAIFQPKNKNPIDILHDRQMIDPEGIESPSLLHWLNVTAFPWLRDKVRGISMMSGEVFTYDEHNKYLIASPNSSGGYLYIGAYRYNTEHLRYELQEIPAGVQTIQDGQDVLKIKEANPGVTFFSAPAIPAKGDKVAINFNGLGTGVVVDYFTEYAFLGLRVKLDKQPEFHAKRCPKWPYALVFGNDIKRS